MPEPLTTPAAPAGLDVLSMWLGRAFTLFGAAWPAWLTAGTIAWAVLLICFLLPYPTLRAEILPLLPHNADDLEFLTRLVAVLPRFLLTLGGVALVYSLLQLYFVGGIVRMAGRQIAGETIGAADLFGAWDVYWPLMLGLSQAMLFVGLAACLCVVPGLLLGGAYALVAPLVVLHRLGPWAGMAESTRLTRQNLPLFVLLNLLVLVIQGVGGALPFMVGTIATFPLSWILLTVAYTEIYTPATAASPAL